VTNDRIACFGCGGSVPDIDGPSHRYMLAAPGYWAAYTGMLGGGLRAPAGSAGDRVHPALTVDAYAVQHPGAPNPQAIQSVWVHLIKLHLALEQGWPSSTLVAIRQAGADLDVVRPSLPPPPSMGPVTAIDVSEASSAAAGELIVRWVDGAWQAWHEHHDDVRTAAAAVVRRIG
jgi:Family of unknown function (DUF5946)